MRLVSLLLVLSLLAGRVAAEEPLTVAVASNFRVVAESLAENFANATGHEVRLSSGSSGKLYGQIVNGAPFDVFLSADRERPEQLERADLVVAGSRFTYAVGALVIVSTTVSDCLAALQQGSGRIAIANPELAPFGRAAEEIIRDAAGDDAIDRLVTGENVAQALHFVVTANAEIGLVSTAQLAMLKDPKPSCTYRVPPDDHAPIEQQAVVLKRSDNAGAAQAFVDYLQSDEGRAKIYEFGYGAR